jgi:hypothetical protein
VLRNRPSLSALALLTALAWTLTALTDSYDSARWRAATRLTATGIPATDIDAGLEWVGYHAMTPAGTYPPRKTAMTWYVRMFPQSRSCYYVSESPMTSTLIGRYHYRTFVFFGSGTLFLYNSNEC